MTKRWSGTVSDLGKSRLRASKDARRDDKDLERLIRINEKLAESGYESNAAYLRRRRVR